MSCWVKVKTAAGADVLNLHDEPNGLYIVSVSVPGETWRRIVATSPVVDGDFEVQSVKDGARLEVVQRVTGSTWVEVEQRRLAVRDALNANPSCLLEVHIDGVTTLWRARRADITGSPDNADIDQKRRTLLLQIPVQPNPTMTGV